MQPRRKRPRRKKVNMLLKVVGIENKKGEFTDKETGALVPYDNIVVHAVNVDPSPFQKIGMLGGSRVCDVKVKNKFDELVYVGENPVSNWRDLIGCTVDLGQDAEGKILGFAVVSIDGAQ